jgi:hypothetical protein
MILVTVTELITVCVGSTVVMIVVRSSTVDVGFVHEGAAVVATGQPVGVHYAMHYFLLSSSLLFAY